jgi:hypothetical protein
MTLNEEERRVLLCRGGGSAVNDAVAGHVDLVIGSAALPAPQVGTWGHVVRENNIQAD